MTKVLRTFILWNMRLTLRLGETEIAYVLKRSERARRLRLTLHPDGELVVTLPKRVMLDQVETLLHQHRDWIERHRARVLREVLHRLPALSDEAAYRANRMHALALAKELVQELASDQVFPVQRITVKNHRTRWGSCSKRGNINVNYRIVCLPRELARYILVHELCHLREMNHSARFWAQVERFVPDHVALRRQLASYVWNKA